MAIDGALQVDVADPFQIPDEECVDGQRAPGVRRFDVAFAELRREPLKQLHLFFRELEFAPGGGVLQAQ